MKRLPLILLVLVLVAAVLVLPGPASTRAKADSSTTTQTLVLYGADAISADSYLNNGATATNYGTQTTALLGAQGSGTCIAAGAVLPGGCILVVKPNLAKIPTNAQIQSVDLLYYISSSTGAGTTFAYSVTRILTGWTETGVTDNSCGSNCFSNGFMSSTVNYTSSLFVSRDVGTFFDIHITGMVESWLNGTAKNNGLAVFMAYYTGTGLYFTLYTKEAATVDIRPELRVVYAAPSAAVEIAPYCSGGPCDLGVFSGSGLPTWIANWSWSGNGNSTAYLPTGNAAVSSANLVLAYNLDSLNNTKMEDFSGLIVPNDGTITGTTVVSGKYGLARHFNHASDTISAGPAINGATTWSFSTWVNWDGNTATGSEFAFTQGNDGGLGVYIATGSGHLHVNGYNNAGSSIVDIDLGAVSANSWHQVGATYNGATFSGYLDGRFVNSASNGNVAFVGNGIYIGSFLAFQLWWGGAIDQTLLWSGTALSASAMLDLGTAAPYVRAPFSGFNANLTQPVTLRALDFFGNELANITATVNANPFFINVPLPYRMLKVDNARDEITNVAIAPYGSTNPMAFSLMPREIWSAPVKQGVTYYLNFTLLALDYSTVSSLSILRTFSTSVSYIVNGTATIDQIAVDLSGTTTNLNQLWGTANLTKQYLIQQWAKVNSTNANVRFVWNSANGTWTAVNLTTKRVIAVWNVANNTWDVSNQSVAVGNQVGNAVLAPQGIDFFGNLLKSINIFGFTLNINIWFILLALDVLGWFYYNKRYKLRKLRKWKKTLPKIGVGVLSLLTIALLIGLALFVQGRWVGISLPTTRSPGGTAASMLGFLAVLGMVHFGSPPEGNGVDRCPWDGHSLTDEGDCPECARKRRVADATLPLELQAWRADPPQRETRGYICPVHGGESRPADEPCPKCIETSNPRPKLGRTRRRGDDIDF